MVVGRRAGWRGGVERGGEDSVPSTTKHLKYWIASVASHKLRRSVVDSVVVARWSLPTCVPSSSASAPTSSSGLVRMLKTQTSDGLLTCHAGERLKWRPMNNRAVRKACIYHGAWHSRLN